MHILEYFEISSIVKFSNGAALRANSKTSPNSNVCFLALTQQFDEPEHRKVCQGSSPVPTLHLVLCGL